MQGRNRVGKAGWAVLGVLVGLVIGFFVGGGLGVVRGSSGGAQVGASVGACEAGVVAMQQGMDAAAADRMVGATLAAIAKGSPMLADPKVTSLASCRSSGVLSVLQ